LEALTAMQITEFWMR